MMKMKKTKMEMKMKKMKKEKVRKMNLIPKMRWAYAKEQNNLVGETSSSPLPFVPGPMHKLKSFLLLW